MRKATILTALAIAATMTAPAAAYAAPTPEPGTEWSGLDSTGSESVDPDYPYGSGYSHFDGYTYGSDSARKSESTKPHIVFNVSGVDVETKQPFTIKWGEIDLEDGTHISKAALLQAVNNKINESPNQPVYRVTGLNSYKLTDKRGRPYFFNSADEVYLPVQTDKDHFNFEGVVNAEVVTYGKTVDDIERPAKGVVLYYVAKFYGYDSDGRLVPLAGDRQTERDVQVGETLGSDELKEIAEELKSQRSYTDLSAYTIHERTKSYLERDDKSRVVLSADGEDFEYEVAPREDKTYVGKDGKLTLGGDENYDYITETFILLAPGQTAPARSEGTENIEVKVRYVHADTDAEIFSKIVKTDLPSVRAQFWDGYSKESKASLFENTITVHGQVYVLAPRVVEESEEDGMPVFTVAVGEKRADSNDSWVYGESTIGEREANGRMLGGFRTATVR